MSRFIFIACRASFLALGVITFNFADRTIGMIVKQRARGSCDNAYLICMEILVVFAPLFMAATSYAMLRLLDARYRGLLFFISVAGIICSIVVEVWTKGNLLLATGLFLIPQLPIALAKNWRAEGWPIAE